MQGHGERGNLFIHQQITSTDDEVWRILRTIALLDGIVDVRCYLQTFELSSYRKYGSSSLVRILSR